MTHGTPEQVQEQKRRYWKRHPEKKRAEHKRYRAAHPEVESKRRTRQKVESHTFLAIDGEGWNDDSGSHNYHMIVTSDPEQYIESVTPLTSEQSLRFIGSLKIRPNQHVVSFFFDYDVTMILRDMAQEDPEECARLFEAGRKAFVWWRGIGIKYVPHKHLTVKLSQSARQVTVHDTQGYFQSSFVAALRKFEIGDKRTVAAIEKMKAQRAVFTGDELDSVLKYSQSECRLLVQLIEKVRDLAVRSKLNPYPYEGPGGLASRAMERYYGKTAHEDTLAHIPDAMLPVIPLLLYGGRFETLARGFIPAHVYEYDRHSAYPAIMSELPCFRHGQWKRSKTIPGEWAFAHIRFTSWPPSGTEDAGIAHQLPIRKRTGVLHYPHTGSGWYWQHEYGRGLYSYAVDDRWVWIPDGCDCHPFAWIKDMFEERERMEAEHKGSGIVLKLILNTLYGKCAQTKPTIGPWCNLLYASIITSKLRTDMYRLYNNCTPGSVYMFATDAIFTSSKLPVSHGLGGLELADEYDDLTIVQPGLYFDKSAAHYKTRGIPKKYVEAYGDEICVAADLGVDYPMRVTQFKGLRMCLAQGHLDDIGQWQTDYRIIGANQEAKRIGEYVRHGVKLTYPSPNTNPNGESYARDDTDALQVAMMTDVLNDEESDYE